MYLASILVQDSAPVMLAMYIFITLQIALPILFLVCKAITLRVLEWKPNLWLTLFLANLTSAIVTAVIFYGVNYLLFFLSIERGLRARNDAWFLVVVFILTDRYVMSRLGKSDHESKEIWWITIIANIVSSILAVVFTYLLVWLLW